MDSNLATLLVAFPAVQRLGTDNWNIRAANWRTPPASPPAPGTPATDAAVAAAIAAGEILPVSLAGIDDPYASSVMATPTTTAKLLTVFGWLRRFTFSGTAMWSYSGAKLDGINVQLPTLAVPESAVLAAVSGGTAYVAEVDARGTPIAVSATPVTRVVTPATAGAP